MRNDCFTLEITPNIHFVTLLSFILYSLAEGTSIAMAAAGPVVSGYAAYAAAPSGAALGEYDDVE